MVLHDFPAARMLCRHVHIALTCHPLAAGFLRIAHLCARHQTVGTRRFNNEQEQACRNDLGKSIQVPN
jgi:hypothetical protein